MAAIWRLFHKTPGGQRYFMKDDDFKAPELREIYVADNSGRDPDCTDDGPLCVALDEPFLIGDTGFYMKVRADREIGITGRGQERKLYTVGDDLDGLFPLLIALRQPTVLGEQSLRIKCSAAKDAKAGARAILKCLAMGVQSL